MSEMVLCPACGKTLPIKGIPKHTNGCPKWKQEIPVPPSEFNFDRHFKRHLYAEDQVEGQDYVLCPICPDHRAKRLADHLKLAHNLSREQAVAKFPGVVLSANKSLEQRKATVKEKYGVDNIAQADDIRIKLSENSRAMEPEVVAKRQATNKVRYGHVNPLGGTEGNRRAQKGMLQKYGARSPQQVPEIRLRTLQTCREHIGSEFAFTAPGFQDQFKETSRANWGTDHPMQSEAGRKVCEEGCLESFGFADPFSSPDVQAKSYQTNLDNHGGIHSQQCPEVREKAKATWLEKYGFDNPSKVEEVQARIKATWLAKYGVPFPPQCRYHKISPNKLEQKVDALTPERVIFTGDSKVWINSPGTTKMRNPDFVVLTPGQFKAFTESSIALTELKIGAVVEVLCSFWHSAKFTKTSRDKHKVDIEAFYGRAGIACLVLWEDEVMGKDTKTDARVRSFLIRWARGTVEMPIATSPILDLFGN